MKLSSSEGKGTGKVGGRVYAVNGGVQIVREYTNKVSNPSTPAQVAQRSKMKLMAQLAASYAIVLAFRKDGLKSARNQFISKNIGNVSFAGDTASINLPAIQLTAGATSIPAVNASRDGETAIAVALSASATNNCARVVYVAMKKTSDGEMMFHDSAVVETAGNDGTFAGTLAYTADEVVIYAYGMKDLSAAASDKYGNYGVTSGTQIATLVATRSLSASDYSFTKTVGVQLAAL